MCISLAKQVLRACDSHDWDEYWATQSSEVLAQVSQNVKNMWEKLVYLPLGKCTKHARHVLIVDALDECDQVTRIPLLKCLLQACTPKSEPQIYLLLTTRKEDDILNILNMEAFRNVVVHLSLRNSETSPADVARYVEYRLDETGVVLTTEQREKLIHRCNGLFIFASLACDLLRDQCADDQPLLLKDILEKFTSLDALYHQTLSRVGNISEYMRERLMGILCIVLVAREPLSIATIAKLLSMSVDAVNTVVKKLGSILGSSSVDQPVYILHATLGEFLIRKNWVERGPDMIIGLEEAKIRSNRYYISKEEGERIMLRGTFANVMAKELVFNICRLETSSLLNEAVTDMNSRVNRWISSALRYSCIHWASHLESTPYDNEILGDLQNFMKNQFLSWLEVLSATKNVQFAAPMLTVLTEWLRVKKHYSRTMAEDMYRFVTTFVSVIAQSLPHIYLSALPFAPRASLVSQCYARSYYSILMVRRGGYSNWPPFQNVLFGHTNQVWSVKFSPDGKCIVSGSEDKTIRVWDVETGQAVGTPLKGHTGMINSITVSPDSKCIVSGSEDRTIQVWDIETGEAIRAPLEAHNDVITSVSFSPDGKRVVSGSRDRTLRVWDAETWLAVGAPFQGHTGEVTSVVFSPDGKHIGSCSWDKTVRVWDVETGKGVGLPFKGHTGIIWSVSFSPDGRHIASGSMDWTVLVWDVMSGQVIKAPFKGHGNAIRSVAFSPDGKYIVSGSQEWTIRVWDVETGQTVGVPFEGHDHGVSSVVFSPDGKRIASSSWDKTVRLWDFASRRVTRASFEGYATRFKFASFMPDDKRIISVSIHTDLQIWHAETGRPVGRSVNCYSTHVLLSPDGRRIAFASHDQLIRIYDLETWQELGAPFKGHTAELMCVVFSPDGKRLASGSRDRTVRVWDIETGLAIGLPLEGHTHDVLSVAFSPDGKRIASGSPDMTVRIWDVETGQAAGAPLKGHTDMVRTVAFSPDGRRIISGSEDKTIRIWDGETGHAIGAPFEGYNDGIYFVTFSPDGEHIISGSGDGIIRFWDTETGQTSGLPYDSHRGAILHISFSSDGKRMVSASLDGTVRLWDITMNKSKSLTSNTQMKNGWIVDSNSKLLFCVPPQFRAGLLWGNNLLIIGGVVKTELNFSSFVYGKNWARFKQPSR
ncbi:hypothetical protein M408DRAFT_108366 [Serendipita vermifera MAFF 305830]|uniref:Nephrocystin 3-like N-terminal domain-containing protein n=1 Tax=Serendipita vermifera MAFF 305830 TaxID=933852 RepID=A0A0C2WUL2_SERVB|nr:hypothetical protein M408DRAFT_108366 [Serendipita vermifera MAFF 305830]